MLLTCNVVTKKMQWLSPKPKSRPSLGQPTFCHIHYVPFINVRLRINKYLWNDNKNSTRHATQISLPSQAELRSQPVDWRFSLLVFAGGGAACTDSHQQRQSFSLIWLRWSPRVRWWKLRPGAPKGCGPVLSWEHPPVRFSGRKRNFAKIFCPLWEMQKSAEKIPEKFECLLNLPPYFDGENLGKQSNKKRGRKSLLGPPASILNSAGASLHQIWPITLDCCPYNLIFFTIFLTGSSSHYYLNLVHYCNTTNGSQYNTN